VGIKFVLVDIKAYQIDKHCTVSSVFTPAASLPPPFGTSKREQNITKGYGELLISHRPTDSKDVGSGYYTVRNQ